MLSNVILPNFGCNTPLKQQQIMYTVKLLQTSAVAVWSLYLNCQYGHTQSQKNIRVSKCIRILIAGSLYTVNKYLNYQHKKNNDDFSVTEEL